MEISMSLGVGALLIAIGVAMVWFGIPKKGKPVRFTKFSFFTEIYIVAAITSVAIGVTIMIGGFPN